ncbi:MAG: flippase-like domain-containing protein [Muribaculaceae bacterium]|nr:flippase-like domain-containing protein [Muribaculaceae bacterium]MDE6007963.1 flippase-like domain-containing protein [Muribaculaceae bacterium]
MTDEVKNQSDKNIFSLWKVLLPVIIGLTVVVLMFWHDAKKENLAEVWKGIHFTWWTWACIVLAFLCMLGRDFGLSWRFRALTDHQLRWSQAFKVDFLCEFTSCITPSAVGGSSLGMVFLNSQGIEFGRATTLMITTLFLDELFFVIFCPIIVLFTPAHEIFTSGGGAFTHGIRLTFWLVYTAIFVWTFILFSGIIWKPEWIRKVIYKIFQWKWLKRWNSSATGLADNMVATSKELRTKPMRFWLEVFGGTALSWTSRYLVVNALFLGFLPQENAHQWVIFAREFVIWVVLMVSPTPGGSGVSEWLFSEYYADFIPTAGMALILAIFWRIISYYVYLCIGAVLVPEWLKKTVTRFKGKKTSN